MQRNAGLIPDTSVIGFEHTSEETALCAQLLSIYSAYMRLEYDPVRYYGFEYQALKAVLYQEKLTFNGLMTLLRCDYKRLSPLFLNTPSSAISKEIILQFDETKTNQLGALILERIKFFRRNLSFSPLIAADILPEIKSLLLKIDLSFANFCKGINIPGELVNGYFMRMNSSYTDIQLLKHELTDLQLYERQWQKEAFCEVFNLSCDDLDFAWVKRFDRAYRENMPLIKADELSSLEILELQEHALFWQRIIRKYYKGRGEPCDLKKYKGKEIIEVKRIIQQEGKPIMNFASLVNTTSNKLIPALRRIELPYPFILLDKLSDQQIFFTLRRADHIRAFKVLCRIKNGKELDRYLQKRYGRAFDSNRLITLVQSGKPLPQSHPSPPTSPTPTLLPQTDWVKQFEKDAAVVFAPLDHPIETPPAVEQFEQDMALFFGPLLEPEVTDKPSSSDEPSIHHGLGLFNGPERKRSGEFPDSQDCFKAAKYDADEDQTFKGTL